MEENVADAVGAARLATLGMLLAGITHEINTPLGALASNHDTVKRSLQRLHDILADDVVDVDELLEVRRIVRALNGAMRVNDLAMQRVQELVSSLRTFGRPDRAQIDLVDIHEGIGSALLLLRHRLGRITVRQEFAELPALECYPQRVNQVFMNLLLNAVQALEGAAGDGAGTGMITIRTRADSGSVVVEIEDDGPGMTADVLARIFEPGFTTKGSRVGMGLGLIITQQVIDQHGGSLQVRSEPGRGTTFSVRLPLRLPEQER
jgi:two-component system, NtrC family, sensor kinase